MTEKTRTASSTPIRVASKRASADVGDWVGIEGFWSSDEGPFQTSESTSVCIVLPPAYACPAAKWLGGEMRTGAIWYESINQREELLLQSCLSVVVTDAMRSMSRVVEEHLRKVASEAGSGDSVPIACGVGSEPEEDVEKQVNPARQSVPKTLLLMWRILKYSLRHPFTEGVVNLRTGEVKSKANAD